MTTLATGIGLGGMPRHVAGALDAYSSVLFAAYGSRRLLSTWSGPLFTVRRSSDNATMEVYPAADGWPVTGTLMSWCGSGSAYVTRWWDQSGLGRHAEQTSASDQALLVNAGTLIVGPNGRPALAFDGLSTRYVISNSKAYTRAAQNLTMAVVAAVFGQNSSLGEQYILYSPTAASNTRALISIVDSYAVRAGGRRLDTDAYSSITTSTNIVVETWHRVISRLRAVDAIIDMSVDGSVITQSWQTPGVVSDTDQTTNTYICGSGAIARTFNGRVSAVIASRSAINIADLDAALAKVMP